MTPLELVAATVTPALVTFYIIVRSYSQQIRAGKLNKRDWNSQGVFLFGVIMGCLWPLTLLWLLARRPSPAERKQQRLTAEAKALRERERVLGIGDK